LAAAIKKMLGHLLIWLSPYDASLSHSAPEGTQLMCKFFEQVRTYRQSAHGLVRLGAHGRSQHIEELHGHSTSRV